MMKLTGTYYNNGQPASVTVTPKAVAFQEYDYLKILRTHRVELDTAQPAYSTDRDNSGKPYELICWTGAYLSCWREFVQVHLQTWNRHTIYITGTWPHTRPPSYPGQRKEMACDSSIIELDRESAGKLTSLLEALKNPQEPLL